MAVRFGEVTASGLAAAIVTIAVAAGVLPLLWLGITQGFTSPASYLPRILLFTLEQAALSTLLSLVIGFPVARALVRRKFLGRGLLLRLMILPQALPAIVVVLGLIGVLGNSGWLPGVFPIYGLSGIMLAHVFFNMPLAARLFLARLEAVPPENLRLAAELGFSDGQMLRFVDWPQVRGAIVGTAALIFLLCAASFAVVLILGGGPQSTTLEVAIYQALKLDFNPGLAAALALAQFILCGALVALSGRFALQAEVLPRVAKAIQRFDGRDAASKASDAIALFVSALIILPPLASLMTAGLGRITLSAALVQAIATSAAIGATAAVISVALGWALSSTAKLALVPLAGLIIPPAVVATGWFIVLIPLGALQGLALPLIVALSSLMALPFVATVLRPAIAESHQRHDRLSAGLGLTGWARLRLVEWPALRKPLALALLSAFLVSLGDLTAVTLLGSGDIMTLPALIYRQMGQYRMSEAGGTALVLALFCLLLSSLAQRWSTAHDPA
jgi:thiamine transport system permease protein